MRYVRSCHCESGNCKSGEKPSRKHFCREVLAAEVFEWPPKLFLWGVSSLSAGLHLPVTRSTPPAGSPGMLSLQHLIANYVVQGLPLTAIYAGRLAMDPAELSTTRFTVRWRAGTSAH